MISALFSALFPARTAAACLKACLLLCLFSASLMATHFRYGHVTWVMVGPNLVEYTVISAWREDFDPTNPNYPYADQKVLNFGDGTSEPYHFTASNTELLSTYADSSGERYVVLRHKVRHQYTSSGPFIAFFEGSARIHTLVNAPDGNFRVQTLVDLRNGNTGSPISSMPVIVQMIAGANNSIKIPVADPNVGDRVFGRLANITESGFGTLAVGPAGPLKVTNKPDGIYLEWNTGGLVSQQKFAAQVILEEQHNGALVGNVALDFIIEIVTGTPPDCVGQFENTTTTIPVGQQFVASFVGTTATGNLSLSAFGMPPGAILIPVSGTTGPSPLTANFQWTPTLADASAVRSINIVFTDRFKGHSKMSGHIVKEALWMVWRLWMQNGFRRRPRPKKNDNLPKP